MSSWRLKSLQELARYDLVGEVRRAIGSTLESGETTLGNRGYTAQHHPAAFTYPAAVKPIPVFSKFCLDYRCRLAKKIIGQYGMKA